MLPPAFEVPVALVLVVTGVLACFAGYRVFRVVLAVYGFIVGAMVASSVMGVTNTTGQIAAALVGGLAGALVMVFAYFIGIALVGAGLAVSVAHLVSRQMGRGDPSAVAVMVVSVVGALGATAMQRYVVIVATAYLGAWTAVVGALAVAGGRVVPLTNASGLEPWVFYPLNPAPGSQWVPYAWAALGVVGTIVQLAITSKKR